jgi:hypothetical protein
VRAPSIEASAILRVTSSYTSSPALWECLFESDDSQGSELVVLHPGQLVVVPSGRWHRLVIEEPSELLLMTPGRTEVRRGR